MENQLLQFLIPAIGLVSGLIGAYVGLQNRVLLAEVRQELAELENRVILKMNGSYTRQSECELRRKLILQKVDAVERDSQERNAAGS